MSQVNTFRFQQKALLEMQQSKEEERREQQQLRQQAEAARLQQQLMNQQLQASQQQPSPPTPTSTQPIRLSNPTPYHIQQTELRLRREQGNTFNAGNTSNTNATASPKNGTLPTPSSSLTNTVDPAQLLMGQYQFQQQLQHIQRAQLVQQQQQQQQRQTSVKNETNSPDFSSSDMDYNEQQAQTKMLSPISASPVNSPPSNGFNQNPMTPQRPFANSPGNTMYSPGAMSQRPTNTPPANQMYSSENPFFENETFPSVSTSATPMAVKGRFFEQPPQMFGASTTPQPSFVGGNSLPMTKPNWFGSMETTHSFPPGVGNLRYVNEIGLVSPGGGMIEDVDAENQRNMQQIYEKRKRRRESHNAVERRRRDNINEKIHELSTLLPESLIEGGVKPNKGAILRKSVDHIKSLQAEVLKQQRKVRELESLLERVQGKDANQVGQVNIQQNQGQGQGQGLMSSVMLAGTTGRALDSTGV